MQVFTLSNLYLFSHFFRLKKFRVNPDDCPEAFKVLHDMCKLWTNFAKYANPTPSVSESASNTAIKFTWTPVRKLQPNDEFQLDYLEISSDKMEMKRNPDQKRMAFWQEVFSKLNGGFLQAKL